MAAAAPIALKEALSVRSLARRARGKRRQQAEGRQPTPSSRFVVSCSMVFLLFSMLSSSSSSVCPPSFAPLLHPLLLPRGPKEHGGDVLRAREVVGRRQGVENEEAETVEQLPRLFFFFLLSTLFFSPLFFDLLLLLLFLLNSTQQNKNSSRPSASTRSSSPSPTPPWSLTSSSASARPGRR